MQTNPDTTTALSIPGMTCSGCVARVEKALSAVDGVESATVNLGTKRATVAFDRARTSLETLRAAVEKAGYEVIDVPESDASASADG